VGQFNIPGVTQIRNLPHQPACHRQLVAAVIAIDAVAPSPPALVPTVSPHRRRRHRRSRRLRCSCHLAAHLAAAAAVAVAVTTLANAPRRRHSRRETPACSPG